MWNESQRSRIQAVEGECLFKVMKVCIIMYSMSCRGEKMECGIIERLGLGTF